MALRFATFALALALAPLAGAQNAQADRTTIEADVIEGVADLEVSRRVFSVCGTSTRVFSLDEQLGAWGVGEPTTRAAAP